MMGWDVNDGNATDGVLEVVVPSADAMVALGRRLGTCLRAGDVVLLHGDLGAGKTTFVQGIAHGLGVIASVQSPTFTLVGEHAGVDGTGESLAVHHLDLYRLTDPDELESFGYDDYLHPDGGISLIEWPERAGDWLPDRFLLVRIEYRDDGGRTLTFVPVPTGAWVLALS
ncbi:MAG: tRNA (adenosine(37)-N6)-threonylcarbamoyltransferase complex ATPase subunit type 1 TsaE [Thermomicrobiales bacterium]